MNAGDTALGTKQASVDNSSGSENRLFEAVRWNSDGLVPVVAQDHESGTVLMMAWMNAEALKATVDEGIAVYWSRSRGQLWRKGETSGNTQLLHDIRLDCDGDTILLSVRQLGGIACHTGRAHCFYRRLESGEWQDAEPVLRDPKDIYGG
ncbi:MAG: phosphoribosyl-AMP cyclohydrolase [Pseudomonadota bacterium]